MGGRSFSGDPAEIPRTFNGWGRRTAQHVEAVSMTQTQQLRRRSCWGMWIGTGATLGGFVVGALACVLCLLDTGAGAADYTPVVALIAGTLGAVGGGIAGTVCAVVTAILNRWTGGLTATGYAIVAASITAAVAAAFGGWLLQPG